MSPLERVCAEEKYSDSFRNYFAFDSADNVIIEVILPFCILCSIFNIFFFCKLPNARQPPFDILLFLSIFSIILASIYIATLIYNTMHPVTDKRLTPSSFNSFCQATGTIQFFTQIGAVCYNLVFCFYYAFKIKNPLRSWAKQHRQVHILCILLASFATIVVYLANQIGVSVLGVCGLKVSKTSFFIDLGISMLYLCILILTSVLFLKYLKKLAKYDPKAKVFFKYFLAYTILISSSCLGSFISITILTFDCFSGISVAVHEIFIKLANILSLSVSIIVTLIICFHPEFQKSLFPSILRSFKKTKKKLKLEKSDQKRESASMFHNSSNRSSYLYDDLINEFKSNSAREDDPDTDYFSKIKEVNKSSLILTILGYLSLESAKETTSRIADRLSSSIMEMDHEEGLLNPTEIYSWNICDRLETYITESFAKDNSQHFTDKVPTLQMKLICYCPLIFQELKNLDKKDNKSNSLNPSRNIEKVKKNSENDGGRSGQFFYFTYDNSIIIKTITKKELAVLLERIEQYYNYFVNHPDSFIVKLHGVYTTLNLETREEIHFMVMGNLQENIQKLHVMRVYDLKGSSHQREVLKGVQLAGEQMGGKGSEVVKKTLKDIDFDRLEQKIFLSSDDEVRVKQVLKRDSRFFAENGLIDYSLIVIKVDFSEYEDEREYFNERTMVRSSQQDSIVYILGIIDYLETWNMRKKGQKWYKSLFNKSESISSQSPDFYSERFCTNLVEKIFTSHQEGRLLNEKEE